MYNVKTKLIYKIYQHFISCLMLLTLCAAFPQAGYCQVSNIPALVSQSNFASGPGNDFSEYRHQFSNIASQRRTLSAGGRYVVFFSAATDIAPTDTNGGDDVFRRDLLANFTRPVSVNSAGNDTAGGGLFGSADPTISADGRFLYPAPTQSTTQPQT